MNIENDKYLKHFIAENKKLLQFENERDAKGLSAIIDHAAIICDNREEFFELMSYGFYIYATERNDLQEEVFLSNVLTCMSNELVCERIHKENNKLLSLDKKEAASYVICDEDELVESLDGKHKRYRMVRKIKR